jgi:hypothetical protein
MRNSIVYTPPNIIWMIELRHKSWVGHVVHMGGMRNVNKIFVGKPEEG